MVQDRDTDNPYQSPCADDVAHEPGISLGRTRIADLITVGCARGTLIGAVLGGGVLALLHCGVVLWTQFAEGGDRGGIGVIEVLLGDAVGFFAGGATLGSLSGLLVGTILGLIAGRSAIPFRWRFMVISVTMSAACGLGWSALFGLTSFDENHGWHPVFPALATSSVIMAAALGGVWLAIKVADAAWGRGDLGSLPKSEAES